MNFGRLIFLALVAVLLAACAAPTPTQAPAPTFAPLTPEPGTGAMTGKVNGTDALWPDDDVIIYAAPYASNNGGGGFYVLEPEKHPHAPVQKDGAFQINNMIPGEYVLVVGPEPAAARLVVDELDKPQIFTVKENEILQAGSLNLAR
jgi:hypothetical protein